jgi:hypothetical protein
MTQKCFRFVCCAYLIENVYFQTKKNFLVGVIEDDNEHHNVHCGSVDGKKNIEGR